MGKLRYAVLAAAFLTIFLAAAAAETGGTDHGITWTLSDDSVLTVSGKGKMPDYGYLRARPWHEFRSAVRTVEIKGSLTTVGKYAFSDCSNLTSVLIPESVTDIGQYAFSNCGRLTSITIPEGVTRILDKAFYGCGGLTGISLPDSVRKIGSEAFSGCGSLTGITLPARLNSLGENVFYGCVNMTSVTIPDGIDSWDFNAGAFVGCKSLERIIVSGSNPDLAVIDSMLLSADGRKLLLYPPGLAADSCRIPDGVTRIGNWAFAGCANLAAVTIPDSVTEIGSSAFRDCTGLTSVTVPDSVTEIEYSAFRDCTALTSVTIPDSVTRIFRGAFQGCSGLTAVTLPDGMTQIEDHLFDGCSGLVSATIPAGVTEIGYHAFKDCTALRDVTVLGRSTAIHREAFLNCRSLNGITGTGGDVPERNRELAVQRNTERFGIIFALLMLANVAGVVLIVFANLGYYHFQSSRHRYSKPSALIGLVLCLGSLTAAWWSLAGDQIDPNFIRRQSVNLPLIFSSFLTLFALIYGVRLLFRKTRKPVPVRNVITEKDEQDVLDAFADVFTRIRSWCDELSVALEDAVRREGGQSRLTLRYVGKLALRVLKNARLSRLTGIDPFYLNNSVSGNGLIGPMGGPGRIRLMIADLAEGADLAVRMFRSSDPETKDKALRGMVLFYDDLINHRVWKTSAPVSNADQIALCMSHYLDVLPVRIYFLLNDFRIEQGLRIGSDISLGEETQRILRRG